jgi:tetraacyldisaccharide 4'-kinase
MRTLPSPLPAVSAQPLERHWQHRTVISVLLLPLTALFALVSGARRLAYRSGWLESEQATAPVVVVGNVTVGGTGKTPLVVWLAQHLKENGYRPGIVSRGYGGAGACRAVHAESSPDTVGEEPVLLAARSGCPVWVGQDRAQAVRQLLSQHPEVNVVLSDDGLQHYRLRRAVEIAVVDGERGFGNGWLLPSGPLREPLSRLRRCDAVVVNGSGQTRPLANAFAMQLEGSVLKSVRDPTLQRPAAYLRGEKVHAVAGVGNPSRFFSHLERLGLAVTVHAFPDHHRYLSGELDFAGVEAVVMTEKDAIKCRSFARDNWWMLPVDARVDSGLLEVVLKKI